MSYKFFRNSACEHFPCHAEVNVEAFNCLFCFCPLYTLGERCGGAFSYTPDGLKDCSGCHFPHHAESYEEICSRFLELAALCKQK